MHLIYLVAPDVEHLLAYAFENCLPTLMSAVWFFFCYATLLTVMAVDWFGFEVALGEKTV